MQKGFVGVVILIAALILAGLAGVYYFGKPQPLNPQTPQVTPVTSSTSDVSPVPDGTGETVNWKTYSNIKEGFSLSYPSNAIEGDREPDPFTVARQFQFSEPRKGGGGGPLSVGWLIIVSKIQQNSNNLTLREWGREKEIIYGKDNTIDPKSVTVIDTSLGGLSAISWKNAGGGDGNITNYLVKRTNGVILVTTNVDEGPYQKIADQILSTFKFIP